MYILKYSTKYLRKKSLHSKSHIYSLPFFNMYNMGMLTIWPPCTCTHGIGSWYYIYMNIFWFLKLRDSKKKKSFQLSYKYMVLWYLRYLSFLENLRADCHLSRSICTTLGFLIVMQKGWVSGRFSLKGKFSENCHTHQRDFNQTWLLVQILHKTNTCANSSTCAKILKPNYFL